MSFVLDAVEVRVRGALIEKEVAAPAYYPLSLNALVNACNQKSNREPVMDLDEEAVRRALRTLDEKALARSAVAGDSRVAKYEHQMQEAFNFTRPEIAVLCELLLRGPQTPGEIRSRALRLYPFEDLNAVHSALERLVRREPPMVTLLSRQPGTKESRYAQLLSGGVEADTVRAPTTAEHASGRADGEDRIRRVEEELACLRSEIAELKSQLDRFRKQFE